jgi:hypothetical protein
MGGKNSLVNSVIMNLHLLTERCLLYVAVKNLPLYSCSETTQTTTIITGMFQNYSVSLEEQDRAKSLSSESSFQMRSLLFYIRPTFDFHLLHL